MLVIVWSFALFVTKSAKKLIVFVITSAKIGLALETVPVCFPTRGKSVSFCCSLTIILFSTS